MCFLLSFHSTSSLFGPWKNLAQFVLHCNIQNILFRFFFSPLKDTRGPHLNELYFLWKEALRRSFSPFSLKLSFSYPSLQERSHLLSTWGDCLRTVVTPVFLKDGSVGKAKAYDEIKVTGRRTHSINFWTLKVSWIQSSPNCTKHEHL